MSAREAKDTYKTPSFLHNTAINIYIRKKKMLTSLHCSYTILPSIYIYKKEKVKLKRLVLILLEARVIFNGSILQKERKCSTEIISFNLIFISWLSNTLTINLFKFNQGRTIDTTEKLLKCDRKSKLIKTKYVNSSQLTDQ